MRSHVTHALLVVALLDAGVALASGDSARTVAAGRHHTCAVTAAGGVVCWGANDFLQLGNPSWWTPSPLPVPVGGLESGVQAVAAGRYHTCALKAGGQVVCWGSNWDGQLGDGTTVSRSTPAPVSGLGSGVLAITAGDSHTCAITAGKAALCWGANDYGQLGNGTTDDRLTPTPVPGFGSPVRSLAAGYLHTCAISASGDVLCWGANFGGQLGDGTTTGRTTPEPVCGLGGDATAIAAGLAHSCAVVGGAVVCWGDNRAGQLGDGSTVQQLAPAPVSGLGADVSAIVAGERHACATTTGGGLFCWGANGSGQAGDGTRVDRLTATMVAGGGTAAVAAGDEHTCAVTSAGAIRCWGSNESGQLGDGTSPASLIHRSSPAPVSGLATGVAATALGAAHACALTTGGAVRCWGSNDHGQLGNGTTSESQTPMTVDGLSGVAAIAAGSYHTCALTAAGDVLCWGRNAEGQVGDGTTTDGLAPTPVAGLEDGIVAVTAGLAHTCALTTTGTVLCWGGNASGQLGDGTTTGRTAPAPVSGLDEGATAVSAGAFHTCALTPGGAVRCWGDNGRGQLGEGTLSATPRLTPTTPVPGLRSGLTAVAAGFLHTCAVRISGELVCWGDNGHGQLGDGRLVGGLTPVMTLPHGAAAVAAGESHTSVLTKDAAVLSWGEWSASLTPTPVSGLAGGVASIAAGAGASCAVTTGGTALCWGDNRSGRLGGGERRLVTAPIAVYGFGGTVTVGGVGPTGGSQAGGTTVVISGDYFLEGATVTFGGVAAPRVAVASSTAILATTPPHPPGPVAIVVRNPDGREAVLNGYTYLSPSPFGQIDTPAQGTAGVVGAIALTGWALDDAGVSGVRIYRNCLSFDDPASCHVVGHDHVVYIGDAAFFPGARPDVEGAFPMYPRADRAGWGFLLLTNMLPHVATRQPHGGQGPIMLYAFATDADGNTTLLGRSSLDHTPTSIVLANDTIARPFGTIDTPGPGETVRGTVANFGWALTPDADTVAGAGDTLIPPGGSTLLVFVDGVPMGQVAYDQCRGRVGNVVPAGLYCDDDVASAFGNTSPLPVFTPRGANPTRYRNLDTGRAAIGAFLIDTTALAEGPHTIAWGVTDSAGRAEGIGSRVFHVRNASAGAGRDMVASARAAAAAAGATAADSAPGAQGCATGIRQVRARTGFDLQARFEPLVPGADGVRRVQLDELGRLELELGRVDGGFLVANGTRRALPPGSRLDAASRHFAWMPPAGYLGSYTFGFACAGDEVLVSVTVRPRAAAAPGQSEIRMFVDQPTTGQTLSGEFVVAGWALDPQAGVGSGIDAVHVWAQRQDAAGSAPLFLGSAALDGRRPDVAAAFGAQFDAPGFGLTAPAMAPGRYAVTAYAWNRRTARWEDARTVSIVVH